MARVHNVLVLILCGALFGPVAGAFALPEPSYWTPGVRIDPMDANYMVGYLTMKGTQGGLSWDPAASSDDPGGPVPDALQEPGQGAQHGSRYWVGGSSAPLRVDTFTSAPLPRTLHVNASRHLHLDLYISDRDDNGNRAYYDACGAYYNTRSPSTQPDPDLRVQVLLDGKLVAGAVISQYIEWWWLGSGRPSDPSPYSACHYRMPPETLEFPQGSVVTIRIEVLAMSKGFRYGLGEDHRSVLRIPVFSDDEWIFRDPKAISQTVGGPGAEAAAAGAGETAVAGLALAGLGLIPVGRRRPAWLLALALLVPLLGSGCLGGAEADGSSGGASGDVKATIDSIDGTGGLKGTEGMIAGLVHDDLHVPLNGVHVSLLGTGSFTRTDPYGRFTLKNLTAGSFEIRFDKEAYVSVQNPVTVAASSITRLDVTLVPQELGDSGRRNHKHDYWGDSSSKLLFDGDLRSICNGATQCRPVTEFGVPPSEDGGIRSIMPGTQDVIVTLNWDPAKMGFERVGLRVLAANDAYTENGSLYYPRRSGEPFHVATTWEMADIGHQLSSTWFFQIYADPADNPSAAEDLLAIGTQYLEVSAPSFRAKIEIVKGALPLEPAHPDHWGGKAVIPASTHQAVSLSGSLYPPGSPFYVTPTGYAAATRIVPFDAAEVIVNLTPTRDLVPATDWILLVKTGNSAYRDIWSFSSLPPGPEFRKVGEPAKSGTKLQWRIPLQPGDGDHPYASKSSWVFAIVPKDETNHWVDYWGTSWALKTIQFTLSAASHRAPSA